MSWLSGLLSLAPALTQIATDGLSLLGSLQAPILPDFLTNNPLPQGYPWGTRTAANTNPYEIPPFTGVTRNYDFTISRGNIAPDGVNVSVILVNGAYPGPTLEANWGDTFQITVHNNLTNEGTGLHWHGFLQKQTPWFDGIPGVTQCPIAPGKTLTYTFQADLYGTSWYHSHYSAQYAGGIYGPIVVHGPKNAPYDIDLGPVLLSDWYHTDYYSLVEQTMAANAPPVFSDNMLINGKGDFNCNTTSLPCTPNAGVAKFIFTPGKTHRLRLINSAAEATQQFSIDGHQLTVIANDFVPVKPYTVNSVTLGVGQRTDVLVNANAKSTNGAFWMRSTAVCSLANQPFGLAAVYYTSNATNAVPATTSTVSQQCLNDNLALTTPFYPFGAQSTPATTQTIDITFAQNSTGHNLWYMNNSTFRANYDNPVLLLANMGNISYPYDPQWNVYNFGSNSSIRFIVRNHFAAQHPMHLHGHNFFVLAFGNGNWDGTIVNANNPQRRDVQILPAQNSVGPGYVVLQINTDNPGVWPFHCHIAWHVSGGLYVNVMEQPAQIRLKQVPATMAQTCRDWATFSGHNVVDQIDSGL